MCCQASLYVASLQAMAASAPNMPQESEQLPASPYSENNLAMKNVMNRPPLARQPHSLSSLSLEDYLDLRVALTKNTGRVQKMSPVERGMYRVNDLKQVGCSIWTLDRDCDKMACSDIGFPLAFSTFRHTYRTSRECVNCCFVSSSKKMVLFFTGADYAWAQLYGKD